MLNLEKVKQQMEKYGYEYDHNILCGHTKMGVANRHC